VRLDPDTKAAGSPLSTASFADASRAQQRRKSLSKSNLE
jgi:hypothetical protein